MTPPSIPPVATDVGAIVPLSHERAGELALEEYRRLATLIESLSGDDWTQPTDCPAWDVKALVGHIVGSMRAVASLRAGIAQNVAAARRTRRIGGDLVDHLTAIQVEQAAALSPAELVAGCRRLVEPAARGRRRPPAIVRRRFGVKVVMGDFSERWTLGYFLDTILTRDAWMHRIDLCRAVGREPALDAHHDATILADIVAEWARRHGRPFDLELSGPAGGRFRAGDAIATAHLELDAVAFARTLAGRQAGTGLLAVAVPF